MAIGPSRPLSAALNRTKRFDPELSFRSGKPNPPQPPLSSETQYAYQYDQYGNWTEQTIVSRSQQDEAFRPGTVIPIGKTESSSATLKLRNTIRVPVRSIWQLDRADHCQPLSTGRSVSTRNCHSDRENRILLSHP